MRIATVISFFFLLLLGCQSREVRPKSTGSEYFPLRVGAYWTYAITETSITQLGGQVNTFYEVKFEVADSVNSSGQLTYIIKRSTRPSATSAWAPIETWFARKDQFQGIMQEGNISYVRLEFPFVDGKSWNGNKLNGLGGADICEDGNTGCDNYAIASFEKPFQGEGLSFENSVTIVENNYDDPIVEKDVRKSVYAKSIGLVYREMTILEYCTTGTCIGKQIVETGHIMKQSVTGYGGL